MTASQPARAIAPIRSLFTHIPTPLSFELHQQAGREEPGDRRRIPLDVGCLVAGGERLIDDNGGRDDSKERLAEAEHREPLGEWHLEPQARTGADGIA